MRLADKHRTTEDSEVTKGRGDASIFIISSRKMSNIDKVSINIYLFGNG
jgi:hypothetical protein